MNVLYEHPGYVSVHVCPLYDVYVLYLTLVSKQWTIIPVHLYIKPCVFLTHLTSNVNKSNKNLTHLVLFVYLFVFYCVTSVMIFMCIHMFHSCGSLISVKHNRMCL